MTPPINANMRQIAPFMLFLILLLIEDSLIRPIPMRLWGRHDLPLKCHIAPDCSV